VEAVYFDYINLTASFKYLCTVYEVHGLKP